MPSKILITAAILITNAVPVVQSFHTPTLQNVMPPTQTWQQRGPHTPLFMSTTQTETPPEDADTINPRKAGLALMLDDGTRKSHSISQNTEFVSGFFKGLGTRESYGALLTSLYFVYSAMETSFDTIDLDVVNDLDDEELRRLGALEVDMEYFYGEGWQEKISLTPNAKRYVERVREIAEEKPYLLVAHQYTRYLGDLFGGRMMGGMAQRSLDLEVGKGVAFYTFDGIADVSDFITDWYTRLNKLVLTDAQKEEIVDEANLVFELNILLLEDLEGSPLTAMWSLAVNTFKEKLGIDRFNQSY